MARFFPWFRRNKSTTQTAPAQAPAPTPAPSTPPPAMSAPTATAPTAPAAPEAPSAPEPAGAASASAPTDAATPASPDAATGADGAPADTTPADTTPSASTPPTEQSSPAADAVEEVIVAEAAPTDGAPSPADAASADAASSPTSEAAPSDATTPTDTAPAEEVIVAEAAPTDAGSEAAPSQAAPSDTTAAEAAAPAEAAPSDAGDSSPADAAFEEVIVAEAAPSDAAVEAAPSDAGAAAAPGDTAPSEAAPAPGDTAQGDTASAAQGEAGSADVVIEEIVVVAEPPLDAAGGQGDTPALDPTDAAGTAAAVAGFEEVVVSRDESGAPVVEDIVVATDPSSGATVIDDVVMTAPADTTSASSASSGADGSAPATIDALLQENRVFPPSPELTAAANINDPAVYEIAASDPETFWAEAARRLDWFTPWQTVLEWNAPWAKWFVGGQLNASYNCVDRHALGQRAGKRAIVWEGEPGDTRVLTYADLYNEVNRFAQVLLDLGVRKGDVVAFYMPMIPELAIGMLACARIGAPHTVIFGGFSAEALRDRINDSRAKVCVTADGGWRRGNVVPLKDTTDAAVAQCPTIERVLVVQRVGPNVRQVAMQDGRDVWYHEAATRASADAVPPEPLDSEHPLYIMYTSGTTGKPKGQLHTTGGYLTGTSLTHSWIFDLKEDDIYWCTADIGWVTGHSYIVYGPLSNGATVVMYEGAPDYPDKDRFWALVEKYGITILYTAPTSIRTFMRWGTEYPARHDLSSLRLMGTVGEPINPEAWIWYYQNIGGGRCPIVDTWWQTETGMIMISPLPGLVATKPGSATLPFPGVEADILDEAGNSVPANTGGNLVIKRPWPAMSRTIFGDPDRYVATYWSKYPGIYLTGDGARRDDDGYYWLLGRVDDVLNVSGHRIGTMEVESALVSHPAVAEAAVIGASDPVTGQAIIAFVTPRAGYTPSDELTAELKEQVVRTIGALARPKRIYYTTELPKTRSAKIMRRLLRDIAEGRVLGDTTTLLDPTVVAQIKEQYESTEG